MGSIINENGILILQKVPAKIMKWLENISKAFVARTLEFPLPETFPSSFSCTYTRPLKSTCICKLALLDALRKDLCLKYHCFLMAGFYFNFSVCFLNDKLPIFLASLTKLQM